MQIVKTPTAKTNYRRIVDYMVDNNVHLDDVAKLIEHLNNFANNAYVTHCVYKEKNSNKPSTHKIFINTINEIKGEDYTKELMKNVNNNLPDNVYEIDKLKFFSPDTF